MESSRWPLARHMVILICMGIASFALAFLGINICFFLFCFYLLNLGIFYVCPYFKVLGFASLLTNSRHIHHIFFVFFGTNLIGLDGVIGFFASCCFGVKRKMMVQQNFLITIDWKHKVDVLCICSFHVNWGESLRDWDLTP